MGYYSGKERSDWDEPKGLLDALAERLERKHQSIDYVVLLSESGMIADHFRTGVLARDSLGYKIRKGLPDGRFHTGGPTFLQWCRDHRTDPAPIGPAANFVILDKNRPKGRAAEIQWESHWKKNRVSGPMLKALRKAWQAYHKDRLAPFSYPHL